jgi:hypothetical protein
MTAFNASSSFVAHLARMMAAAMSAAAIGTLASRKGSMTSRDSSLWAKYRVRLQGRFGGGIGVRTWGKEPDCSVNVREREPVPCYLLSRS